MENIDAFDLLSITSYRFILFAKNETKRSNKKLLFILNVLSFMFYLNLNLNNILNMRTFPFLTCFSVHLCYVFRLFLRAIYSFRV